MLKMKLAKMWQKWLSRVELLRNQETLTQKLEQVTTTLEQQGRSHEEWAERTSNEHSARVAELKDFTDRQRVLLRTQNKKMKEMQLEIERLRASLPEGVVVDLPVVEPEKVEEEDPSLKLFRKALAISKKGSTKMLGDVVTQKLVIEILQAKAKADRADDREGNEKDTMQEFVAEYFIGKFGNSGTMWAEKCGALLKTVQHNGAEGGIVSTKRDGYGNQFQNVIARLLCLYRDEKGGVLHQVDQEYEIFLTKGIGDLGAFKKAMKRKKGEPVSIGHVDGMKAMSVLNAACESLSTDENIQMNYVLRLDAMAKSANNQEQRKTNTLAGSVIDIVDFSWLFATLYAEATRTGNVKQKRRRNSTVNAVKAARRASVAGISPAITTGPQQHSTPETA